MDYSRVTPCLLVFTNAPGRAVAYPETGHHSETGKAAAIANWCNNAFVNLIDEPFPAHWPALDLDVLPS